MEQGKCVEGKHSRRTRKTDFKEENSPKNRTRRNSGEGTRNASGSGRQAALNGEDVRKKSLGKSDEKRVIDLRKTGRKRDR